MPQNISCRDDDSHRGLCTCSREEYYSQYVPVFMYNIQTLLHTPPGIDFGGLNSTLKFRLLCIYSIIFNNKNPRSSLERLKLFKNLNSETLFRGRLFQGPGGKSCFWPLIFIKRPFWAPSLESKRLTLLLFELLNSNLLAKGITAKC